MRLAFIASDAPAAQDAAARLVTRYGACTVEDADALVVLGGDGFMLRSLHRHHALRKPFYGMKLGRVGFLMNQHHGEEDLPARLARAHPAELRPLELRANGGDATHFSALAFNEVSLLRQTNQAAHITISLNGTPKLAELVCDGVLVSTPAGSTAYNLSAHGPILPLDANVLALTPISPFRPRRWRGALLPAVTRVGLDVLDADTRPVSVTADFHEFRHVTHVDVAESRHIAVRLLFDPEHNLEQRILDEQFEC